jgi:tripartite ATP-independent transporter DctP family solute receptor
MKNVTRRDLLKHGAAAFAAVGAEMSLLGRASAEAKGIKLQLGTDLPAMHPLNVRLKEAVEAISAETKGRVAIALAANNQLGNDSEMLSHIKSGTLQMAALPGVVMSTLIPETAITSVGFAFSGYDTFSSYDRIWTAMDGGVGDYIRKSIERANLKPFDTVFDNGFRQITTTGKPIRTPQDLHNLKLRIPVVPLWESMFKKLGASTVSVPVSDVYRTLQSKVADAQENPLAVIDSLKLYEVQKYCSLTNHAWDGFWLVVNGNTWKSLPVDVQGVLEKHFNAAAKKQRDDIAKANTDLQKKLEAKGLKFNHVDQEPFRAALKASGFYTQAEAQFGTEAWGLLQTFSGRFG